MVKVVKLKIWVLGEFVLDDPLVYLLAVVFLSECLFDVSIPLFFGFCQNGGLYQLEMCIDDFLNVINSSVE